MHRTLLSWALLALCSNAAMAHTEWTFAYSDNAPPYSASAQQRAVGLFPDIVDLVFRYIPDHEVSHVAVPWARAQYNVRNGWSDGLLTYPSDARKEFMVFSAEPLYVQDYGNLVYSTDNPNAEKIGAASSFEDLAGLTVVVERGSSWEEENIPQDFRRVAGQDPSAMMHLLFRRAVGDFLIMPAENARYLAQRLGYLESLAMHDVDFIPDSPIPFHLGVSSQLPNAQEIIERVEAVMKMPEFQSELQKLVKEYR